jgi:MoaA/NifB/PqqE/SkfB family radical SAM enzyme
VLNWRELPELARFVRAKFNANLDFNMLTGNPRDAAVQLPPLDDLAHTVDKIYAARDNTPAQDNWFRVYKEINLRTNVEKRQVIPCRAGSLIAVIDANGDVRACSQLPPLGNLRDQSIREIWNSPLARQQHRAIIGGGCACNNDCYLIYSLNYYWKAPLLMLRQRLKSGR